MLAGRTGGSGAMEVWKVTADRDSSDDHGVLPLPPGSRFPEGWLLTVGRALHTTPSPTPTPLPLGCTWLLAAPAPPSYTHDSIWPENKSLLGNYKAKRSSSTARFQVNSTALLQCHLCACRSRLPRPAGMTSAWVQLPSGP